MELEHFLLFSNYHYYSYYFSIIKKIKLTPEEDKIAKSDTRSNAKSEEDQLFNSNQKTSDSDNFSWDELDD